MAKNNRLTDAHRAFIHTAGFAAGIVPIEDSTHDMRRAFASLPEEEQRKLKRKFRKMWRKILRAKVGDSGGKKKQSLEMAYGKGAKIPTKHQRNARKQLVAAHLEEEVVKPMLEQFQNMPKKKAKPKTDG